MVVSEEVKSRIVQWAGGFFVGYRLGVDLDQDFVMEDLELFSKKFFMARGFSISEWFLDILRAEGYIVNYSESKQKINVSLQPYVCHHFEKFAEAYFGSNDNVNKWIKIKDVYIAFLGSDENLLAYSYGKFKVNLRNYCNQKGYVLNPIEMGSPLRKTVKIDSDGNEVLDDKEEKVFTVLEFCYVQTYDFGELES
jgi:hypothetical protein